MRIGIVRGTVVSNRKDPGIPGGRFVLCAVRTLADLQGGDPQQARGDLIVAFDNLGAGVGQTVAISEGGEATQPFKPKRVCIDAYVAALLEQVHVGR